ncbi:MAG TPA: formate/nitrite transporter family protein [Vicinamibacterales bacterium]|nr:formate/nitrite transporter family protein [Vicinamibacterales bacterium]
MSRVGMLATKAQVLHARRHAQPFMKAHEDEEEDKKALDRRALSAHAVHTALRSEGESELEREWTALAWSGLAAGLSMGLSMMVQGTLRAHLPDTPWRGLISSFGYSVGFLAVVLGRQQLFTETTLTACLPLLHSPSKAMFGNVVRLWIVVFASNMLGALVFAWVAAQPSAFDAEVRQAFSQIAQEAIAHGAWNAFVRAIIGGWIIALMVWLLPSAESARPWIVIFMTYGLAAANLTHIIAGSIDVFYGIAVSEISWGTYFWGYGLPVLAGNSIGGIVFVALLNHAQVAHKSD